MRASTKRFLTLLASLALLLATIGVYALLLRPAYAQINQLRGDLASKRDAVETQTKIVAQVKELLDRYQSVAGVQQGIAPALPDTVSYPTLIEQVTGLAQFSQLSVEGVSLALLPFKQVSEAGTGAGVLVIGVVELTVNLAGSYEALKLFLQTIETNIRVMDIVRLAVTGPGKGGFAYTLTLDAYYQSLPKL